MARHAGHQQVSLTARTRGDNLSEIIRQALNKYTHETEGTMNITEADIHAAAKHLATVEGDAWVFEPPKMDGITRSGTAKDVYLRIAKGALEAVAEQRANPTPQPDHV